MADRVPYEAYPTISPEATPPSDYQNIQTSPRQFGAQVGQGLETLGQGTEQAALEYTSVQAMHNANDLLDFAQKQFNGDPNDPSQPGALNYKGADALRAIAAATDAIQAKRQELMSSLPPVGQQEFERSTFNMDRALFASAATHARNAMNEWAAGQAQAQQNNGLRGIADGALRGDPDLVDASRQAVISGEVGKAQARYGTLSPEMQQDAENRGKALAAVSQVRALAHTDPNRASAMLDVEAPFLTGEQYDVLKRELQGPLERSQDADIVRGIIGGGAPQPSGSGPAAGGGGGAKGSQGADPNLVSYGQSVAVQNGVPWDIFQYQIAGESGWNPKVGDSSAGAQGIAQFIPDTAAKYSVDVSDPKSSLSGAARYMADNYKAAGSWTGALNMYLSGKSGTNPAIEQVKATNKEYAAAFAAAQRADQGGGSGAPSTPLGVAVGDSIAVQQIRHGIAGGEDKGAANSDPGPDLARVGDNPQTVLSRITAADPSQFRGKAVFLSTGASNDPSQVATVADQVAALKAAGASAIVIPGVGPGVRDQSGTNAQLKTIADKAGATFFQPQVKWQADGVHPAEVDKVRDQAQAALAQAEAQAPRAADGLPAGFPTLDDWAGKIPPDLSSERYNRIYTELAREHGHLVQATSAERGQVTAAYKGGLAMLSDGRDFNYDPAQIRRLFPADTADEMIGNLDDARTIGQQKIAVRTMSPDQIAQQLAANDMVLSRSSGPGYARQAKLADSFRTAAQQHFKALQEDPASYVLSTNPDVQRAAQAAAAPPSNDAVVAADRGTPSPTENFASTMLGEQERLGVPADQRHVLTKDQAVGLAQKITGNPEMAPAALQAMSQRWGAAWPEVWRDVSTAGKLPAAYQMVGALEDQGDGALLARALHGGGEKGKTEALDVQLDKGATGTTRPSQAIRTRIAGDENIARYAASMRASGASDQQIGDIVSSVETLAKAKALYNHEDPAAAADHAIASAIGKWEFMPNGGARVPHDSYDAVTVGAAKAVDDLTLDKLAPPGIYGTAAAPGQASADDWLRVLKASPQWVTAGQAIRLMDNGGRFVRTRDGKFVEVPFNTPATASPPPQAPAMVPPTPMPF